MRATQDEAPEWVHPYERRTKKLTDYVVTAACVFVPAPSSDHEAAMVYSGGRLPAHTEPDLIKHFLDSALIEEVPAPDRD